MPGAVDRTDLSQSNASMSSKTHQGIAGQRNVSGRLNNGRRSADWFSLGQMQFCKYLLKPAVNFRTTWMCMPCSSRALWAKKNARKFAIQSDASATCSWHTMYVCFRRRGADRCGDPSRSLNA
ncbi:hypothetical protein BDR04DRAFT_400888 [Suillus decipiens]|nr:hypothetical protein BDR04DRAFT_400888 [Suillus decipiens]